MTIFFQQLTNGEIYGSTRPLHQIGKQKNWPLALKMLLLDIYTKRKRLTSKNKDNLLAGVMMTKAMTNKNGLNFKLVELCMAGKKRGDKNTKPKRNWTRWTRLPWSKLIIYILMWNIVSSTELVSCDGMTVCSVQPVERKSVTCAYIFYVAQ